MAAHDADPVIAHRVKPRDHRAIICAHRAPWRGLQSFKGAQVAHVQLHRIERRLQDGRNARIGAVFGISQVAVERRMATTETAVLTLRRICIELGDRALQCVGIDACLLREFEVSGEEEPSRIMAAPTSW